jgi:hypothetical protein
MEINFTLSDIETMLDEAQNCDKDEQVIVFEWIIDGVEVFISVGDDND